MRIIRILAFLSFAVALHAQSRGKVLIVHSNSPTTLDTIVKANVIEPVEIDTEVTGNLNNYDALFLQDWSNPLKDSLLQSQLVTYIDSGGKLYIEDGFSVPPLAAFDSLTNPLWARIGIIGYEDGSLLTPVDTVFGVDTEFTSNISLGFTMDLNGVEDAGPYGQIIPILFAAWNPIAYISMDTTIRVVLGDAPDPNWPEYYAVFINDVVCNYFNLCAADVKTAPPVITQENISIVRDSRDNGYSVSGNFTTDGEISVFNSLGINVWSANVQAGEHLVELPATLRNGFYFVSVRNGDNVNVARFSIVN